MRKNQCYLKHSKAHVKTVNLKVYFDFLEQIKSSSFVLKPENFGSRNTQGNLVPYFCNIQKLLKERFLKKTI